MPHVGQGADDGTTSALPVVHCPGPLLDLATLQWVEAHDRVPALPGPDFFGLSGPHQHIL